LRQPLGDLLPLPGLRFRYPRRRLSETRWGLGCRDGIAADRLFYSGKHHAFYTHSSRSVDT
jgi:hypothetical protein